MNLYFSTLFIILMHSCRLKPKYAVESGFVDFLNLGYEKLKCPLGDCCNNYWIPNNITKLQNMLKEDLYGQHIAKDVVLRKVAAHLKNARPSKPLVMSFHGWAGSGKTHVAYLVAKSLYRSGDNSRFFHHFMATNHFPHQEHEKRYQDEVRSWVRGNVSMCSQSLFVFDEVDKMPAGVLDGIKSFLDNVNKVDRVDYRKSIFIFISNTGGKEIVKKVHDVWLAGDVKREDLTHKDFYQLIKDGAFNEKGGLQKATLIENSLIDVYVPFLPMEKKHVCMCAENEFKKQHFIPKNREEILQKIVDELHYFPKDMKLYSTTGCRGVSEVVGLYMFDQQWGDGSYHSEL